MRSIVFIGFVGILCASLPVFAQLTLPGVDNTVQLSVSPLHPTPHTQATFSIQSAYYDLQNSTITWSVNGTPLPAGAGHTSITITMGGVGESVDVVAEVSTPEGTATAELLVIPASVDVLWEATSYVPPFYQGRALPSSGSSVTFVALPHLVRPGTTKEIPAADLTYTWRNGNQVLADLSGKGKSSARIGNSLVFGRMTISVEASTLDGEVTGTGLVRVENTDPALTLYQDHPLFGILWNQALDATTFIPETEMSFVAIPYFAPVSSANSPLLQYDWSVNQKHIAADPQSPNEITLSSTSSAGTALVSLNIIHSSNLFFSADGRWGISLNTKNSGFTGFNPFLGQ